jgi:hypothetical protein
VKNELGSKPFVGDVTNEENSRGLWESPFLFMKFASNHKDDLIGLPPPAWEVAVVKPFIAEPEPEPLVAAGDVSLLPLPLCSLLPDPCV